MTTVSSGVIRVRDFMETASTRERGRRFYADLDQRVRRLELVAGVLISFAGVKFVSPSFLDETVVRLVEDHPELRGKVVVEGLSNLANKGLSTALHARGVAGTLIQR